MPVPESLPANVRLEALRRALCINADSIGTLPEFWAPTLVIRKQKDAKDDAPYCEGNPYFLQLIPYIVVTCKKEENTHIFYYRRSKGGGESKLHDMYSIGFGGHVEGAVASAVSSLAARDFLSDLSDKVWTVGNNVLNSLRYTVDLLIVALLENIYTEIYEELGIGLEIPQLENLRSQLKKFFSQPEFIYLKNEENPEDVNNFHIGIPVTLALDANQAASAMGGENEIDDLTIGKLSDIIFGGITFEAWSAHLIKKIVDGQYTIR
jgi:predicted NUDIX family phosphoesterase